MVDHPRKHLADLLHQLKQQSLAPRPATVDANESSDCHATPGDGESKVLSGLADLGEAIRASFDALHDRLSQPSDASVKGKQSQLAVLDRLESIRAALAAQDRKLEEVAAQQEKLAAGAKIDHANTFKEPRISQEGIDKIPTLKFFTAGCNFKVWRNALYLHIGTCPHAIAHLRSVEHDADGTRPRTANYDAALDCELAWIIYHTVTSSIQEELNTGCGAGSDLMKQVMDTCKRRGHSVQL
ncbi:hypothetical protein OC835_002748 [Tilletia horrida]|nr:hypothetical protein OC835_002748 [Tilletia horrida]